MVAFQAITVLIIAFFVIMLCFGESISTKLKEDRESSSIAEKIEDVRKMSMEWKIGSLDNACVYSLKTKMFTHYKEIADVLSEILKMVPKLEGKTRVVAKTFLVDMLDALFHDKENNRKKRLDIEQYAIPLARSRNADDLIKRLEDECVGDLSDIKDVAIKTLYALKSGCVLNYDFEGDLKFRVDEKNDSKDDIFHRYTEKDLDRLQDSLQTIKEYCADTMDMELAHNIIELLTLALEISKNADDSRMYKKFNTYYMPEMLNMIEQLAELLNARKGACLSSYANDRIEKIKQMLYDLKVPFKKILDSLMEDDATKLDVDLETMRDMLKMDGLVD